MRLNDDIIVLLYLTSPSRTWDDIERALRFMIVNNASTLLCKKSLEYTPYLFFYKEENNTGSKVIQHDFCRRQDYRECFEVSRFIGIFTASEVKHLDTNLWKRDTIFMPIDNKADIDCLVDLNQFLTGKL